jgi:hypothetical protein
LGDILAAAGGTIALEVCPFQAKEASQLENLSSVIARVAPVRELLVVVHLGFHANDSNCSARIHERVKTVKAFVDAQLGSTYGSNVGFMISPMLEDGWDPLTARAHFRLVSEGLGGTAVPLVRSSTVANQNHDGLTTIVNSSGARFPILREYHAHSDLAPLGQLFSNDGNVVFSRRQRRVRWNNRDYLTEEDENSYANSNTDDKVKYTVGEFKRSLSGYHGLKMLWRPAYNGRDVLVGVERLSPGVYVTRYDVSRRRNTPFAALSDCECQVLIDFLKP